MKVVNNVSVEPNRPCEGALALLYLVKCTWLALGSDSRYRHFHLHSSFASVFVSFVQVTSVACRPFVRFRR